MKHFLGAVALTFTCVQSNPIVRRQNASDLIGLVFPGKYENCNADQQKAINEAFGDARILASDSVGKPIDWNSPAAIEYFGPPAHTEPYRDRIIQNFDRAWADHNPIADWWFDRYIEVHCDDPKNDCSFTRPDGTKAEAAAYMTQANTNNGQRFPLFNFCPGFFNVLPSLGDAIQMARDGKLDKTNTLDMRNRAVTFLHEMLHIDKRSGDKRFIGDPTIKDNVIVIGNSKKIVYKPALAKYLANSGPQGAETASRNNDNYAYYALAKYIEREFNIYPQLPRPYDPAKGAFVEDDTSDAPNDIDNIQDSWNNPYTPGPPNPDSLYPADYLKNYRDGDETSATTSTTASTTTSTTASTAPPATSDPPKPVAPPGCSGTNLNSNFPPGFVLTDGQQHSVRDILYRMRDQACQGKCVSIDGVPSNLSAAKVQNTDGCEFAAKIATDKELYFYATGSGQDCYDATAEIIDQCIDSQKRDAGWVNGPNEFEFYQAGVRPVNGDGSHHDPITDPGFLGHRHVACQRPGHNPFADQYQVYISQWDDGDWGKSIQKAMGGCHLSVTGWKYEDYDGFTFADGSKSEKIAKFNTVLSNGGCIESKIEAAMGLTGGGLNCPYNHAEELNEF